MNLAGRKLRLPSARAFALLLATVAYSQLSFAVVFDPASSFETGWLSNSNPNGVWSYGYSSTLGGPITLYTAHTTGNDSPNQQMLTAPAVNCCVASPSVGFNNGPAFDNGNVAQAAKEIILVSSVFQNLPTNLIFTAPLSGNYSLVSSFIGAQRGIGVGVAVLKNSTVLFNSSVTAFGQVVPFNTNFTLAVDDTVTFAVLQGSGLHNTGLHVTLTTSPVPEPEIYMMLLTGLSMLWYVARRRQENRVRSNQFA